ncbi:MAG: hypothetical protein HW387_767 [Parachlamydiales bacterium]|nr:hypothetical protein [Parachlamydiales bacterium]
MFKKYLSIIENTTIFKTKIDDKKMLLKCLRILGFGSLMSFGGLVGFALSGLIGGSFGLMLGYVAGKLLKI